MRRWKDEEDDEKHNNLERWLLTYSDMITLLLVLFIMMYTISNVDVAKFKTLAENLSAFFNNGQTFEAVVDSQSQSSGLSYEMNPSAVIIPSLQSPSATTQPSTGSYESSQQIADKLNALIKQNGIQATVSVHIEERGVVVRIGEGLLFPSGSAQINPSALDTMNKIAQIIQSTNNYIRVEGSTDNVPIQNNQFPSNWELASQRAINVVKLIISDGVAPTRVSVTSYGEYRPVASNENEVDKQMNRRVDIVFLNKNLNASEAGAITSPSAQ